ncbi:MAG: sugar phosphate isomerase/epimerase [Gemmatimonadetes bacterium]|nr:sugar phosphate isomerase/epimerase [Gemmatimonadota bacterium]
MLKGLAISTLAWPRQELGSALDLARELGLAGIEVAPYDIFGRWDVSDDEVREVRMRIEDRGLVCPALQGVLFNAPGAALFESAEARQALARQLRTVARIAGTLGARACVFGAPRQRDPGDLSAEQAREIARLFFASIGPVFTDRGTSLAIEANAREYGCRFLTTTAEAFDFVRQVGDPGIALQLDTGTLFLEMEDLSVLRTAAPAAVHAHVSEPQLQPLGSSGVDHSGVASALKANGYNGFLSIEMRAVDDWRGAFRRAVRLLADEYVL